MTTYPSRLLLGLVALLFSTPALANGPGGSHKGPPPRPLKPHVVKVVSDAKGHKLQVDGRDFMVKGMNWTYVPIGTNYSYNLFGKSDDFIKKALAHEMGLLSRMGANTIRFYAGIPPKWVTYIYKTYGIYTAINHTSGRWGIDVDGAFVNPIDYSNPKHRAAVVKSTIEMVNTYKDVPGIVMWMLGNENNYGLVWKSAEIEALPKGEQQKARAKWLYVMWGEVVEAVKQHDSSKPTAIVNGDLQYLSLIKEYVLPKGLDILGSNSYRGKSFTDLWARVKKELNIPVMLAEFGADAYNAKEKREDHLAQAFFLRENWQEMYEQAYGMGRSANSIGGMTFQWADGWWKSGQTVRLEEHDNTATWPNGGYYHDFVQGQNNMNEEWFGICAKGKRGPDGQFKLYPRSAYYVLQKGYELDPYDPATTLAAVRKHWGSIKPEGMAGTYERSQLDKRVTALERIRLTDVRMELSTFWTGGTNLDDAERMADRFDTMQHFFIGAEIKPVTNLQAKVTLSILGNAPTNPIDEIFYERRGQRRTFLTEPTDPLQAATGANTSLQGDLERLKVHRASFKWETDWFKMDGFYREGHGHWGYDGDFFGLMPEAYYGPSIDIYNSDSPIGVIVEGKGVFDGLTLAAGPELWWGANPAVMAKYTRKFGDYRLTLMHHEDLVQRTGLVGASNATPEQLNRRSTIALDMDFGEVKLSIGAMSSGSPRVGQTFYMAEDAPKGQGYAGSDYYITRDQLEFSDTLAAKAKLTYQSGPFNFYAQGAYKGMLADGGPDMTRTFTGWRLKENGRGNHWNALMGVAVNIGPFQIAPNFIYQRPLTGPMPLIEPRFNPTTGAYFRGFAGRNILNDPFVVRGNREQLGAELMLSYDPTPQTWMWAWDNEIVEDAEFAASLNFVYRHLPTIQDAGIGRLADDTPFGFPTSAPAHDLWEVNARVISNPGGNVRLVANLLFGTAQANGDSARLVERFHLDGRITWERLAAAFHVKVNDWGPFDYHRDFNFTFPLQLMADISYAAAMPKWLGNLYTKFGVRGTMRYLDEFSNRFKANPTDPDAWGQEWELRAYIHLMM